jgi:hypothetical protein
VPWLITQRPAVLSKDVLSQADMLIAMKLTASQDRDAIGAWIEGQADRAEGKRILADLPRLGRGEGYLWAPGYGLLERVLFLAIRTFDSSKTPRRGERVVTPRTLAEVDLTAITEALAAAEAVTVPKDVTDRRNPRVEAELAATKQHMALLEDEIRGPPCPTGADRGARRKLASRFPAPGSATIRDVPVVAAPVEASPRLRSTRAGV